MYTITTVGTTQLTGSVDVSQGLTVPWNASSSPVPFKIFRQPVKSVTGPFHLPSPAVIDLTWSGIDPVPPQTDQPMWDLPPATNTALATSPISILFAPDGSVDHIYRYSTAAGSYTRERVASAIYLLVGKRDQVDDTQNPSPPASPIVNISDLNCLWVAINANTGFITVSENLPSTGTSASAVLEPPPGQPLGPNARMYARESSAMGG
jgi:hypothetical protein